jgi:hypothetical protein
MSKKKATLEVKVTASEDKTTGTLSFEGSLTAPYTTKSKLANKEGVTKFETLSALKSVARRVADAYGLEVNYDDSAAQRRVAAKKKATPKTTAPATSN